MPAHSRSKNGVASLAYVLAPTSFLSRSKGVDGRDKPGHDDGEFYEAPYSAGCSASRGVSQNRAGRTNRKSSRVPCVAHQIASAPSTPAATQA